MKPVATEKAIMLIESQNVLTFEIGRIMLKPDIRKEIEDLFDVKVEKIRVMNKGNKKIVYAKLKKEFPAIDVATKLGLI
ncbi:50S ribosomal protein L23 [Candidatus Pacearchaeota archaeon RBG_16_35_8]|nr:MAG: 50S ribosomal protein L23 [Candidatus Pacearchaeota archaeon RBG_16_35_8]